MIRILLRMSIAGAKSRMEDHLDRTITVIQFRKVMEKPDILHIQKEELRKLIVPDYGYNEEGWIKYGIRITKSPWSGRIRDVYYHGFAL